MMYLFHDIKLAYIIVPATGSNSFHSDLKHKHEYDAPYPHRNDPVKKMTNIMHAAHLTAQQYKKLVDPKVWDEYEKIAFVRHPYAWANSIYNKNSIKQSIGIENTSQVGGSFLQFLETLDKTPYFWFTDPDGKVMIDTIYRTEDLDTYIFGKFGLRPKRKNETRRKKVKIRPAEKEIIDEKFAREFTHYSAKEKAAFDREWLIGDEI